MAYLLWTRRCGQKVSDLCRELGVGERRLERMTSLAMGLSPKRALTLTRFLRACAMIRSGEGVQLADVAHSCGYYDQAHFNGDFRSLAGMTPREFAADRAVAVLPLD